MVRYGAAPRRHLRAQRRHGHRNAAFCIPVGQGLGVIGWVSARGLVDVTMAAQEALTPTYADTSCLTAMSASIQNQMQKSSKR